MKRKVMTILTLFVFCVLFLFGCGTNPLSVGPSVSDTVYGNGGMAVQKGDYLYFVNGYESSLSLTYADNRKNDIVKSAIYRVKLNADGSMSYDDDGNIENIDKVVSKVAGFENTGLYIFGDFLYYATPNNQRDTEGDLRTDLIDFYRVKLDGSENKKIFTTSDFDSIEYEFYNTSSGVTLVVYEGARLVTVNMTDSSIGGATVITDSATSAVMPELNNYTYGETTDDINTYIYYSRAVTDDDNLSITGGNIAIKVKIGTNAQTTLSANGTDTITFLAVKNSRLYFTLTNSIQQVAVVYESKMNTNNLSNVDGNNIIKRTIAAYTTVIPMPYVSGSYSGLLVVDSTSGLLLVKDSQTNGIGASITQISSSTSADVLAISGGYVVYTDGTSIYYQPVDNSASAVTMLPSTETALLTIAVEGDICSASGRYFYYYKEVENDYGDTTYYLFRTDLFTSQDTEGVKPYELVGVYAEGDEPTAEEEDA